MKICAKCNSHHGESETFCSTCGSRLVAMQPNDGSTPDESSSTDGGLQSEPRAERRFLRWAVGLVSTLAVLIVVSLVAIPAIVDANEEAQAEAAAAAAAEERRLAAEGLRAAFDIEELRQSIPSCENLTAAVNSDSYDHEMQVGEDLDRITDAREAAALRNEVDYPDADVAAAYSAAVMEASYEGLTQLFEGSERDDIAKADQKAKWKEEWSSFVLDECGVSERFEEIENIFEESLAAKERFILLAESAPWYPENFDGYGDNLAYRWSTFEGGWPCNSCSFWKMTVMTKDGCPGGIYAELNILKGGTVVGWTNDRIASLRASQTAVMEFVEYPYRSGSTGQLTEMTCR